MAPAGAAGTRSHCQHPLRLLGHSWPPQPPPQRQRGADPRPRAPGGTLTPAGTARPPSPHQDGFLGHSLVQPAGGRGWPGTAMLTALLLRVLSSPTPEPPSSAAPHQHCPGGCTSTRSPTGAAPAPRQCPGSSGTHRRHMQWPCTSLPPAWARHGSQLPSPRNREVCWGGGRRGGPSPEDLRAGDHPEPPAAVGFPGSSRAPRPRARGCRRRGSRAGGAAAPRTGGEPSAGPHPAPQGPQGRGQGLLLPPAQLTWLLPETPGRSRCSERLPDAQPGACNPPSPHRTPRDRAGPGQCRRQHGSHPSRGFLDTTTLEAATKNILPPPTTPLACTPHPATSKPPDPGDESRRCTAPHPRPRRCHRRTRGPAGRGGRDCPTHPKGCSLPPPPAQPWRGRDPLCSTRPPREAPATPASGPHCHPQPWHSSLPTDPLPLCHGAGLHGPPRGTHGTEPLVRGGCWGGPGRAQPSTPSPVAQPGATHPWVPGCEPGCEPGPATPSPWPAPARAGGSAPLTPFPPTRQGCGSGHAPAAAGSCGGCRTPAQLAGVPRTRTCPSGKRSGALGRCSPPGSLVCRLSPPPPPQGRSGAGGSGQPHSAPPRHELPSAARRGSFYTGVKEKKKKIGSNSSESLCFGKPAPGHFIQTERRCQVPERLLGQPHLCTAAPARHEGSQRQAPAAGDKRVPMERPRSCPMERPARGGRGDVEGDATPHPQEHRQERVLGALPA